MKQIKNTWVNPPTDYEGFAGFVYCVTELDTGMKYIGIKRLWKTLKLKPLKGKKNKRHKRVESDWRTYNTSNKELQVKLANNPLNYEKKVLTCCLTVTDLKAMEAYMQLQYYFDGYWDSLYNEMIHLRIRIRKTKK